MLYNLGYCKNTSGYNTQVSTKIKKKLNIRIHRDTIGGMWWDTDSCPADPDVLKSTDHESPGNHNGTPYNPLFNVGLLEKHNTINNTKEDTQTFYLNHIRSTRRTAFACEIATIAAKAPTITVRVVRTSLTDSVLT
jgi:hypothetical protein